MYDFSGGVWTINPDGSGLTEVIPGVDAGAIALDLLNGKMYYADWVGGVFSANLDGSGILNIYNALDGIFVWGIAVDPDAGKVYVSDKSNLKIVRMNLDGSEPVDWLTGIEPYAMYIYDPLK
jgi:DNA-binding beta-propeller fold protein YncE